MHNPYPVFEMQQISYQSQTPYKAMSCGQPQVQFAQWKENPDQLSQMSQIMPVHKFPQSRQSELLSCQNCQQAVKSRVEYKIGKGAAFFACLTLPKAPCCCIVPLLWNDFKDAQHVCPMCQNKLGKRCFLFEERK